MDKNHPGFPEGSVTFLSQETIAKRWYSSNWTQDWNNPYSSLRDFLNGTFYNQFSDSFKAKVITTALPNKTWDGTSYSTNDNVFILSGTELGGGPTWAQEIGTVTAYFQSDAVNKRKVTGIVPYYWTRSPVKQSPSNGPAVLAQAPWNADGWGGPWAPDAWFGARPAINLMSDTMVRPSIDGSFEIIFMGAENDNATVDMDSTVAVDALANDFGNNLSITSVNAPSHGTAVIEPQVLSGYPSPQPPAPGGGWYVRGPVLKWNGYEFWPYTNVDNRVATLVAAYDRANGIVVGQIEKAGARYIHSIKVDAVTKKVAFIGQSDRQVVYTFAELGGLIGKEFIQNISYTPSSGFAGTDLFTYTVSDDAGRMGTATVTVTVIDKLPPVSTATATPGPNASGWNNTNVEVFLSASDNVGVAAIMYKLGEADWAVYQGPLSISSEGEHNLSFYATDQAGNQEAPNSLSISIDKTPPVITGAPDEKHEVVSVNSSLHPPAPTGLKIWGTVPLLKWNGYEYWAYSYNDNRVAMNIIGYDANGNIIKQLERSGDRYISSIHVDVAAKKVYFRGQYFNSGYGQGIVIAFDELEQAINANGWYNADVTVSFTAADSLSGVDSVTQPVNLGEGGNQSVTGTVVDLAGNTASFTVGNINVDKTVPAVIITSPVAQTYTQADLIPIHYTVDAGISGEDNQISLLDGIPVVNGATVQGYTLPLGTHTLLITAVDRAGNQTVQNISFITEGTVESSSALIQEFTGLGLIDPETALALGTSVDAALTAMERGQTKAAQNNLAALVNKIQAQSGKKVDASVAEILIAGIQDAAQKIGQEPKKGK